MKRRITSLAVALTFLHSQIAYALPVKNNASNGVQFNKNQNTLNITAPDKSVINYDSFNIAANEAVNFVQPGASASVLNRVLSGGASTINGALAANGNVLLVNPSGVMFGGGATVNANSFIASTKNITDANFQAGLLKFEGSTSGTIVNNGLINGSKNVGLIAANIENKGTIKAGKNAGLIAGNTGSVSVDFDGDGLINFTADSSTIGSGTIKNSGTIKAGQVLLTANDVSNVLENVINNTGTIEATKAVAGENGAIQLISDASVKNTGNLKAPEGKIIINTGGDMNSEGTISAVDGEVDIEATGDVTSSGTLEAGKLTEKGATFGISGTFSVDESSLKNDDDAIEFTGDTTLTGNISDVDNIIVGSGVTLTLAADVTLTAGADTNSNTAVNDSSNISPGGGVGAIDFIWMADDAVIDGAGFDLTFDSKGTKSFLTSIIDVNDLTFLNGNTNKVSDTVDYQLKKDITTTGIFTVGEGVIMSLYPIDAAGAAITDIKLTADSFAAGGTGDNAGSFLLLDKGLTLDATSAITDSVVNFYVTDVAGSAITSSGKLQFLGHQDTKFDVGVSNYASAGLPSMHIRVNGFELGDNTGRVANLEVKDTIREFAAAHVPGGDFVMNGSSSINWLGTGPLRIYGDAILMDDASSITATGNTLGVYSYHDAGTSYLGDISAGYLSLYGPDEFHLRGDLTASNTLYASKLLHLSASDNNVNLTAGRFSLYSGIKLNNQNLTLDATSSTADSSVNIYINDQVYDNAYSFGSLSFLGNANTKFNIGVTNNDINVDNMIQVHGINMGNAAGRVANISLADTIGHFTATGGATFADFNMYGSSVLTANADTRVYGRTFYMDDAAIMNANGHNFDLTATDATTHSVVTNIIGANDLAFFKGGTAAQTNFDLNKDIAAAGTFTIGDKAILHTNPTASQGVYISDIKLTAANFAVGGTGDDAGSIYLQNDNLTLEATSATQDSAVNLYVNDGPDASVYSTGSLNFLGHQDTKYLLGVSNLSDSSLSSVHVRVNGFELGDSTGKVANLEVKDTIRELGAVNMPAGDDFIMNGSSSINWLGTGALRIYGNSILMDDASSITATGNTLGIYSYNTAGTSYISSLIGTIYLQMSGPDEFYLSKDLSVANSLSINALLHLAPKDSAGNDLSDISLTAGRLSLSNVDLNNKNLTLDATSAGDSMVNFYLNDTANNTVYSTGSVKFLNNPNAKFYVGLTNNDSAVKSKIMTKGFVLGDSATNRLANLELANSIGEISAAADTRGDFEMHGFSTLKLNNFATIAGDSIQMDEWASVDANSNHLILYAFKNSKIGQLSGLRNTTSTLTFLDADVYGGTGAQIEYDLFEDYVSAYQITIGDEVKLRCTRPTTVLDAYNLYMGENSQINAWDAAGNHNNITLQVNNWADIEKMMFVNDLTFSGGGRFELANSCTDLNVDGNFTLGIGALLNSYHDFTINALGSIIMERDSHIIARDTASLTMQAFSSSVLWNVNTESGDLILEGTNTTPTDYTESGTITCSNNNTPTYINAN